VHVARIGDIHDDTLSFLITSIQTVPHAVVSLIKWYTLENRQTRVVVFSTFLLYKTVQQNSSAKRKKILKKQKHFKQHVTFKVI